MKDYLSTIRIPIEDIPEAKRWKVGGRYQIVAEVEQTGINRERDYGDDCDEPVEVSTKSSKKKKEPKYRTMVEFKVYDVRAKDAALKERIKKVDEEY